MKKRYIWIIVILVIAISFFTFGKKLIFKKEKIQYRTAELTAGEIRETVTATGTLGAVEMVNVGTQVSGTIARINVDFNSRVRKGDVIAQIDPTSLQTAVTEAEANLQKAKLSVQLAKLQMDPIITLSKQSLVSQSDVDNARISFELAQANVKTSQAQLSRARTNLENATITAPINGVVISRAVDVGQTVAASFSTPTLFSIAKDLTQMEVIASVDEADIGKIKTGQTVTFNVDAFADREYEGKVTQIRMQPSTENNVVTYNVVISARNDDQTLLPGMTANLTILVARKDSILKTPVAALRFKPAGGGKDKSMSGDSSTQRGNNLQTTQMPAAKTAQGKQQASEIGQRQRPDSIMTQRKGQHQQFTRTGEGRRQRQNQDSNGENKMARKPQNEMEPGKLYILVNEKPQLVKVMTGLSDGTFTEIKGNLKAGDEVIIGIQPSKKNKNTSNGSQNQAPGFSGPRGH